MFAIYKSQEKRHLEPDSKLQILITKGTNSTLENDAEKLNEHLDNKISTEN